MVVRAMGWTIVMLALGAAAESRAEEITWDRLTVADMDLEQAEKLKWAGKYPEAVTLAERALQLREKELGRNDVAVMECLHLLGVLQVSWATPHRPSPCFGGCSRSVKNSWAETILPCAPS